MFGKAVSTATQSGAPHPSTPAQRIACTMDQRIVGFHQDEEHHWVAELACGHHQHVRHDPPWTNRPWVVTLEGRNATLGQTLACRKCDQGAARDWLPAATNT
jgi:hypothetical protein